MGKYRDKVEPTAEGLDELDESTRNATIDRLIAAIQHKRIKPETILELTQHFRNRQSIEEKELYRLGGMSAGYNMKWATNHNRCFGTAGLMLSKRQCQYKTWREMLAVTTPRFKSTPRDAEEPQSLYKASFLTHRPYEQDIWGPASYGRLVYDLWEVMGNTITHMEDGRQLCDDMISEENAIDQDPERKEELFWEQYYKEAERNRDTIELHAQKGIVDTEHPEYKKMLSYSDGITGYARNDFHKPSETSFSGFVVTNETLAIQNNDITPTESKLFGRNIPRIMRVRFLIDHLEELISMNGQRFDKVDTMYFIKWCNPKKSPNRKDNEHEFFIYMVGRKTGSNLRFYGWPSLFKLRKDMGKEDVWKKPVAALNKNAKELWEKYNKEAWEPEK
jgi:hypothetical protein